MTHFVNFDIPEEKFVSVLERVRASIPSLNDAAIIDLINKLDASPKWITASTDLDIAGAVTDLYHGAQAEAEGAAQLPLDPYEAGATAYAKHQPDKAPETMSKENRRAWYNGWNDAKRTAEGPAPAPLDPPAPTGMEDLGTVELDTIYRNGNEQEKLAALAELTRRTQGHNPEL